MYVIRYILLWLDMWLDIVSTVTDVLWLMYIWWHVTIWLCTVDMWQYAIWLMWPNTMLRLVWLDMMLWLLWLGMWLKNDVVTRCRIQYNDVSNAKSGYVTRYNAVTDVQSNIAQSITFKFWFTSAFTVGPMQVQFFKLKVCFSYTC